MTGQFSTGVSRNWFRGLGLGGIFVFILHVWAHSSSDGFLTLNVAGDKLSVRLDLAVRDLEVILPLDPNGDGKVTWGEVCAAEGPLRSYISNHLTLAANGGSATLEWRPIQVARHSDGAYLVLAGSTMTTSPIRRISIDYQLLFDLDHDHRGLVSVGTSNAPARETIVLSPSHPHWEWQPVSLENQTSWRRMIGEGVHHIWTGYDHLLFLLSLLLPSVILRTAAGPCHGAPQLGGVVRRVVRVVTAFTVAHSVTLALAALGWARLPSRGVESVIALSVLVVALNNVWPFFREQVAGFAFAFGLIHGFGFAGALAELDLSGRALARGLVGFNFGVELGQLTLVALFLPIAFWVRGSWVYRRFAVIGGSGVISLIASGWLIERAFDLRFMPF